MHTVEHWTYHSDVLSNRLGLEMANTLLPPWRPTQVTVTSEDLVLVNREDNSMDPAENNLCRYVSLAIKL
jgi:hypothetical protein